MTLVPLSVTSDPEPPVNGENAVISGVSGSRTTRGLALVADPLGFVTTMGPLVAPSGTAVERERPKKVNVAGTPLKVTAVTVLRLLPLMLTGLPGGPRNGVMLVIDGPPGA